jgi:hypothetical protein
MLTGGQTGNVGGAGGVGWGKKERQKGEPLRSTGADFKNGSFLIPPQRFFFFRSLVFDTVLTP